MDNVKGIMENANEKTNPEILAAIHKAANAMAAKKHSDYWLSDAGQAELLRMIDVRAAKHAPGHKEPQYPASLCPLDYTQASKAMLSPLGPAGQEE